MKGILGILFLLLIVGLLTNNLNIESNEYKTCLWKKNENNSYNVVMCVGVEFPNGQSWSFNEPVNNLEIE